MMDADSASFQYIFVNMFTGKSELIACHFVYRPFCLGVVVENFSYVLQSTGGARSVTREEMRAFKKVWAEFANQRTGFLEHSQFVPFFAVGTS
jgi:hypothetical protein